MNQADQKANIVDFTDQTPGASYEVISQPDETFRSAQKWDATLDEFFSRPVKIATYSWQTDNTVFQTFNPWTLFFTNPRVINKIVNYNLLRCKLNVKVVINGNGFHFGRLIMSYIPLDTQDNMTVDRGFFIQDCIAASQRPHIYIDPTHSQGGQLKLPFFFYKDAMSVPEEDWDDMGTCVIHTLAGLRHANLVADTLTISVFAWAEDVELAIPTSSEPGSLVAQSGNEPDTLDEIWDLSQHLDGDGLHILSLCNTPPQIDLVLHALAKDTDGFMYDIETQEAQFVRRLVKIPVEAREMLFSISLDTFANLEPLPPLSSYAKKKKSVAPPDYQKQKDDWKPEVTKYKGRRGFGPQSGDEYGKGIISQPASTVAKIAGMLRKAPVIGPYARATEIGAGALADVARMFGYSRPTLLTPTHRFDIQNLANLATCDTEDTVTKLTIDSKQELCVDPRTVGLGDSDEMDIKSLCQRESFLTQFDWLPSDSPETLLQNFRVSPMNWAMLSDEIHHTPSSFVGLLFDNWRGTIKYRIQICSSNFHKGRIKIVYDPYYQATNEYNTNYTYIVDVAENKDFTVEVGWGSPYPWLRTSTPGLDPVPFSGSAFGSPSSFSSNGVLSIFVVNELTTPNSPAAVKINVMVSCGDDIEFGAPSNRLTNYTYFPQSGYEADDEEAILSGGDIDYALHSIPEYIDAIDEIEEISEGLDRDLRRLKRQKLLPSNSTGVALRATLCIALVTSVTELLAEIKHISAIKAMENSTHYLPQSGEDVGADQENTDEPSAPMQTQIVASMGAHLWETSPVTKVCMGESVQSLRQLVKRYSTATCFGPSGTLAFHLDYIHPMFPLYRGTAPAAVHTAGGPIAYNYYDMTLLNYIVPAFTGWRGSIRVKVMRANNYNWSSYQGIYRLGVPRSGARVQLNAFSDIYTADQSQTPYDKRFFTRGLAAGGMLVDGKANSACCAEIPFQVPYRFAPAKRSDVNDAGNPFVPCYKFIADAKVPSANSTSFHMMYAGGEDFTCFWFTGAPIMKYQTTDPAPP